MYRLFSFQNNVLSTFAVLLGLISGDLSCKIEVIDKFSKFSAFIFLFSLNFWLLRVCTFLLLYPSKKLFFSDKLPIMAGTSSRFRNAYAIECKNPKLCKSSAVSISIMLLIHKWRHYSQNGAENQRHLCWFFLPVFSILQIDVKLSQNNVKIQKVTPLYNKMTSQNKCFVLETAYAIMAYTRLSHISALEKNILPMRKSLLFNRWE